ncbi:hypothetical protein ACFQ9V_16185 [Leifsonia sp. NPDC056665]|uniref:hypothetical protein n=1 Tax=Leifsonia sp. NPDC056665 TaxID=3345901 RepID=UPI0036CA1258
MAVIAGTAVIDLSFESEATSQFFVLGVTIGNVVFVSVIVASDLSSRWRADSRWKAVRRIEPEARLHSMVLDAPTCVSLWRLGALDSTLSVAKFHGMRAALTAAVSQRGMRIYAGVRDPRVVADIPWSHFDAVSTERVRRNGLKRSRVLRIRLNAPGDELQLFFTVGSSGWKAIASEKDLDDLRLAIQQHKRAENPRAGADLAGPALRRVPFGTVVAANVGYGARTYFNRDQALIGILGCIYVTGWVNSSFVFLTRHLSPFVTGFAASYSNVFLFGLILLLARRAYVSAFFRETRGGYTTLRWLAGDIPQVDEVSGRVVRMAGQRLLSKDEEEADFSRVRSKTP